MARDEDPLSYRDPRGTLVAFPKGVERTSGNADSGAELVDGVGQLARVIGHFRGPIPDVVGDAVLYHDI